VKSVFIENMDKKYQRERVGSREKFGKPREGDRHEERISRTMSSILRHNAEKQGVPMRKDGYVKVSDLVSKLEVLLIAGLTSGIACSAKTPLRRFYNVRTCSTR